MRDLLEVVDTLESKPSNWIETLEPRKREEIEFHNGYREPGIGPAHSDRKLYAITKRKGGFAYRDEWLRTVTKGKTFLDYACGDGQCSIAAAKAGAALAVGIDISDVSVANCRRRAYVEGVSANTRFLQADCEDTGFPDNSFDCVLCSGMLHHLDLSIAIPELKRILKPGGRVLAMEALNYNPLITLYRRLTPHLRTEWETHHIISHKSLRLIRQYLKVENIRYFHFADIATVPFAGTPVFPVLLGATKALDSVLLRIPGVRLMAWQMTFEMVK